MVEFGPTEAAEWLSVHGAPATSVELKTLLEPPAGAAAEALTGRRAPTWSVRQTYLVDTEALDLLRVGLEIRLQRRARGRFDLAVSAQRPGLVPDRFLPRGARREYDLVPGDAWQEIEVRRGIDPATAAAAIAGSAKPQDLLSASQSSWACTGGSEVLDAVHLGELEVHGPSVVRRIQVAATGLGLRRADLEHFRFPSGQELVELSTRCGPAEVARTAAAFRRLLDERGVAIAPEYRTKTSVWHEEIAARRGLR